jgi:hypothetical protein
MAECSKTRHLGPMGLLRVIGSAGRRMKREHVPLVN